MTNPKHTDTSRSGDLVERLRERTSYSEILLCHPPRPAPDRLCHEAADRIEALEAENERLAHAWETQHGEKVKERKEARLWFEKAQTWKAENERLREALGLADAALRGANMNMNVVERKVRAALKEIEGD